MSMGKRTDKQRPLWLGATELPRSAGHRFYEKLNELLSEAKFDRRAEQICAPYFEADDKPGRPSIPPGVYFRMLFVGYFEGIESERGLEWRCADSLSLRTFLGVQVQERVPDHSSLSRMRTRLDGDNAGLRWGSYGGGRMDHEVDHDAHLRPVELYWRRGRL